MQQQRERLPKLAAYPFSGALARAFSYVLAQRLIESQTQKPSPAGRTLFERRGAVFTVPYSNYNTVLYSLRSVLYAGMKYCLHTVRPKAWEKARTVV